MFYSVRQTSVRFKLNLSSKTLECHDPCTSGSFHIRPQIYKLMLSSSEPAPAYTMAANAGVIKAFTALIQIRHSKDRGCILINDLNTVHALKKHLIQFLGLKELTLKYGLGLRF